MRTKEEYIAVLNETVQYYSEDVNRRSESATGCYYFSSEGKMCAIGRMLVNPKGLDSIMGSFSIEIFKDLDYEFKPEYKGFDELFYQDLQVLHDGDFRWNEFGLTQSGKEYVAKILEKINQGVYARKPE